MAHSIQTVESGFVVLDKHMHSRQYVYPTLQVGTPLTSGAANYADPGVFTQVIPAGAIPGTYDVHWAHVWAISDLNSNGEIALYDDSNVEISRFPVAQFAFDPEVSFATMMPVCPAGGGVKAKFFSSAAGTTCRLKLMYHLYSTSSTRKSQANVTRFMQHIHSVQKLYPTLAVPINPTAGAAAYGAGALTPVVPAGAITNPFDLHWVVAWNVSQNDDYELAFFDGGGTEISRCVVVRSNFFTGSISSPLMTEILPANTQVDCRLYSQLGGNNLFFKIMYHEYT